MGPGARLLVSFRLGADILRVARWRWSLWAVRAPLGLLAVGHTLAAVAPRRQGARLPDDVTGTDPAANGSLVALKDGRWSVSSRSVFVIRARSRTGAISSLVGWKWATRESRVAPTGPAVLTTEPTQRNVAAHGVAE